MSVISNDIRHVCSGSGERTTIKLTAPFPFHFVKGILVFIPELYGDLVIREREKFLSELIALFLLPISSSRGWDQ